MRPSCSCVCLFTIIALLSLTARAGEPPPSERWHVEAAPDHRLVHGWMSVQRDGDSLVIREHVGGGTDRDGLREPLVLSISWFREDGALRLLIRRTWNDKRAESKSTPAIPKGASLRVGKGDEVAAIDEKYQVLWRADVVQKNRVASTLVYVARLAPIRDGVDGLNGEEATKALEVVKRAAVAR